MQLGKMSDLFKRFDILEEISLRAVSFACPYLHKQGRKNGLFPFYSLKTSVCFCSRHALKANFAFNNDLFSIFFVIWRQKTTRKSNKIKTN